jgi:calcineurin-like phosphoesterase family protein
VDIDEMDFTLVSEWNKNVTMNDVVVHAGDFIESSKISSWLKPI